MTLFLTIGSQVAATIGPKARTDKLMNFELTAVTPVYADGSVFTCRAALTVDPSAQLLAGYIEEERLNRIALFVTNDEQGESYETKLSALVLPFAEIVRRERYQLTDIDFRTQITRIKASKPDALLVIAPGQHAPRILQQLRELGFNRPLLSNNWTIKNPFLTDLSLANGVVFTDYQYQMDEPSSGNTMRNDFVQHFRETYREDPPIVAATAYDALNLIASAVNQGITDASSVASFISRTKDYPGASGDWTFNSDCEASQGAVLRVVKNGQFVPLGE
ncbi:MAG: hypothetical protein A2W52_04315 [Candidatus Taylorbacteria bacterium RIFCSPHIGHO2_02_49_25]|uniref:Leucine-binding protein domain-containing protein n=1 Tax=Candidatus Taylorbacteria bacterium RIFCSPHIGHO2_02_49_25 TaxID=1802305 RepID=A0A1G2MFG5_9BACT|nr:MAG: hypothetical protein A2759_01210 [Candidatus Taylorbacteria bacterium RIFCSPHIGHO2_01_FULL_49_60]OHA22646.1 MAG: hypothetical protein A2W52_04315 [Candidatus Taylorbacteria bacterium RIFCSPHIGHO2_02_49_25]OHA36238.1 MAG: hypothetical protein A3B27_00160 [Candidatus Taylorbacteria bacterium RIFCSPLOWO2_01_FULL_50_130]OHA36532.1 MAG: hypothetical protein A2W65_04480 [Candidatus Taylorbacteria bacterium RIFCSPLOWO2_02_50_13]OHA48191.1 MAG: hypothetical protein A3G61_04675 [Candidatus Taylo